MLFRSLLAIVRQLAHGAPTLGEELAVLAMAELFTILPAAVPLVAAVAGGATMAARVQRLGQWTNANGRYILAALFLVFGLQDILKALGR